MEETNFIERANERFGRRWDHFDRRHKLREFIAQENPNCEDKQHERGDVKHHRSPAFSIEQLVSRRIEKAEVQKQRSENDEGRVLQKSDSQVEIAVMTCRRVEMEDERCQTECCEVKSKWGTTALL